VVTGLISGTIAILLGDGCGNFERGQDVSVGAVSLSVVVGDFNRDGVADLAVTVSNDVLVLLGTGDGTFQSCSRIAVGEHPAALSVGDFDGDGIADLAVVNARSNDLWVLLGRGDGTFEKRSILDAVRPVALVVVDLNGDGYEDLAVTSLGQFSGYPGTLSVFLGRGDGTFRETRELATSAEPYSIAAADFNDDGFPDLVISHWFAANVAVMLGNGDGSFQVARYFGAGVNPAAVVVSDFNRDGKPDIAVSVRSQVSINPGDVAILINNTGCSR